MANCAHVEEIKDIYFEYLIMRELFECILELGLLSTQISPKWVLKFGYEVSWLESLTILLIPFKLIFCLFMLHKIVYEFFLVAMILSWIRNSWQIDFSSLVNCLWYQNRHYFILSCKPRFRRVIYYLNSI